ncbi:MAG: response regulator [Ignavibacteriae bacterium]|nr:response regulator [Ignavibacteria bacterium]MBI3365511.1 response regulator [Ignavibacteriota bacterium]
MNADTIHILLVEDNKDFAKLVQVYLQRFQKDLFTITWKQNHADALQELQPNNGIDVVLMDYFLPGRNGLEITREIKEKKIDVPIIFLTVNKDFELALDVMKLGVDDYLVKEEISSPVLPKTVLNVIEKHRLKNQLDQLEISQQRLKAIRETLASVLDEFEPPLHEMHKIAGQFKQSPSAETYKNYLKIIEDNVLRIMDKLEKLKTLKQDKTIKYIKDIKMLDLS